jgi:hypothetical protein
MNISSNNEKIERYLDELADEYKMLLLENLIESSESLDDLSISEMLRLDNEIKKPLYKDYQRQERRRRSLFTIGIVYIFLAIILLVFMEILKNGYRFDTENLGILSSIIIGSLGFFSMMLSLVKPVFKDRRSENFMKIDQSSTVLEYEIVQKWRELEGLVNDISINENLKTPRSIIGFLYENNFIDGDERTILKDLLKMRNTVVHSEQDNFTWNEKKDILSKSDKIIERIKKIV